ncbi:MAG: tRNA pseudouridine(38-40) synthase TruA [Epsilonproteobacteria bacterium]|nr:MAG: tRNA pseudouridine(38-40) synthase TruA [Campylobacterota bacterium]RLA66268.1 MAG: tRNA pseudouridine(38-40) synthase TruA [Campylobacterota bacterium]
MKKFYYQISTEYRGQNYFGWQIQPRGKTIQGEINHALEKLCKSDDLKTLGASRTDSGVHAKAQVFKADLPLELPLKGLVDGLNSLLPEDIKILGAKASTAHFHPLRDSKWKRYNYLFTDKVSPFSRDLIVQAPALLDIELMREGAKLFLGTHDFANFRCMGTDVPTTTREILEIELKELNSQGPWGEFPYYCLEIKGTGFLKQMVRLMMGSLWNLGRKKITLDDLQAAIDKKKVGKVGPVAPPQGLYLTEIQFA